MRTRVSRVYHVATGRWVFHVDCWRKGLFGWMHGIPDNHWWPWPLEERHFEVSGISAPPVFQTSDESHARRVAREVSEGKLSDPYTVIEYADGVEFSPTP